MSVGRIEYGIERYETRRRRCREALDELSIAAMEVDWADGNRRGTLDPDYLATFWPSLM